MTIAILGTGDVGRTLAARLAELGRPVVLGTRDPETTRGRPVNESASMEDWLAAHPVAGLRPRQVPVRGVDSKWLSAHRRLVTDLVAAVTGSADLGLVDADRLIRLRILDDTLAIGGLHDLAGPVIEDEFEFEAFLLEALSTWQVPIPEFGTVRAARPPIAVLTSNRTREVHDALKRRCLYHWVDYPAAAQELEIIRRKAPGCNAALSQQIVAYVQKLRGLDLFKNPGVAETIDWATALTELDRMALDPETVSDTLGTLLKYQDDIARIEGAEGRKLLDDVKAGLAAVG